jgi:hypothetical protein
MRIRPRRSALLAALALAVAAPGAAADKPGGADASSGTATAHISWDGADVGVANVRLTITRNGVTTFDGDPFAGGDCGDGGCSLAPLGGSPLTFADLDGDGTPELLVDSFTGGAHCCQLTQIFRAGATAEVRQERNWADPGYRLKDLDKDGRPEFVTYDAAFGYQFAAFAFSLTPIKILDWQAGTFRNRTTAFPAAVRADLRSLQRGLSDLKRRHLPTRGAIAAITADYYSLGQAATARRYLARSPGGSAFHARVLKFLHRYGYR